MSEWLEPTNEPLVCTVAGTHSAGKTTLVHSVESGKIAEILDRDLMYDDFGYGRIEHPEDDRVTPVIVVPETARWCAEMSGQPDLLGANWNLEFQLQVNNMYMLRAHAAFEVADEVSESLAGEHPDFAGRQLTRPLVLTDRSVLEGLAYTRAHLPKLDADTIGGFPRAALYKRWTAHYVDLVLLANHSEIPFEPDPARVSDLDMREDIARGIAQDYHDTLPSERIEGVAGDPDQRATFLVGFVREHLV